MQCKQFKKCGACRFQSDEYEKQLAYKQNGLNNLLSEFSKVERIIPMENPFNYRNKVQCAFYFDYRKQKCSSGVYQSTSKRIIPIDYCMLDDKGADDIIISIRKLADDFKLRPYDIKNKSGFLRHVLIRKGFKTGETMVVIVTASPVFPSRNNFVKALLKRHSEITTIIHNVNPTDTNLILGEQSHILYGKGYIEDILCSCTFRISPASFYQVNPVQTEKLYNMAIEFAEIQKDDAVFDAYCGTGTIGIIAAKKAGQVLGVELNEKAVNDAVSNAKKNDIKNIYFIEADATKLIDDLAKEKEHFDVVFMDPPRAGASREFLLSLLKLKPKKIIYISCNPKTLARDLKILTKKDYTAEKIQGVDMFPFTEHIETVVSLKRKD
ncbi:MAG: 23S rRNA (uracil(1939)-C(5))-methyltransferase RlmD [Eubacterium sp.]|nr:23S rRNA (uracil(1939)-C(5))-methyltransferase RlmD [Eubacterium sp.]